MRARDPVTLQRPLKYLDISADDIYDYQVEKEDEKENTNNLPGLWR